MKITKKRFVLIALFVFPLLFFLILSTGINNFKKLPTLTNTVSLDVLEDSISLTDHVTVLCFLGNDVATKKGGFFNLNQKIYKEFYGYRPFQIIAVYPKSSENEVEKLKSDLSAFTDMTKWNFLAMNKETIQKLHKNLKTENKKYRKKSKFINIRLNLSMSVFLRFSQIFPIIYCVLRTRIARHLIPFLYPHISLL